MPGRPRVWPWRKLIDGTRLRARTGIPWRDVPAEYGPWGRVYDLFRRWQRQRDGTWYRILSQLQSRADSQGSITWDLNVDSTVCRAHGHAAGARKRGELQKEPPGGVFVEPDGCRARAEAHIDRRDRRAAERLSPVRDCPGAWPGSSSWPRAGPEPGRGGDERTRRMRPMATAPTCAGAVTTAPSPVKSPGPQSHCFDA
ncbi:transposase [Streptomyces syringium]|uniref:transposase n=1 Tax=Streptomyces syringium TaxID=76729 RepID=UPI0037D7530B